MKKIGLVGYYQFGNFGDDLMAMLIARVLRAAGADPVILSSNPQFSGMGFGIEPDEERLVSQCDAIVLGGGGALLEHASDDPEAPTNQYSRRLLGLARAAGKRQVPLYAVSIGGESRAAVRPLRAGIVAVLTSPMFQAATVRLQSDVDCLRFLGASATYCPDMVLATPSVYQEVSPVLPTERHRLGVQCRPGPVADYLADLAAAAKVPELVFIHTAKPDPGLLQSYKSHRNIGHYHAEDLPGTLGFLSGLRAVIGNRLHVGLAAAAFGVPFYVAEPLPKVTRFFEDLELPVPELINGRIAGQPVARVLEGDNSPSPRLARAREDSAGHFDFIRRLVG